MQSMNVLSVEGEAVATSGLRHEIFLKGVTHKMLLSGIQFRTNLDSRLKHARITASERS